jgi:3-oxoacyl-[acyl-carrier-protein] synthase-1
MRDALARAGLAAEAIGYLNLHGTATPANDAIEARTVAALFSNAMPDSLHAGSTKGWTGHTLGAAGIVESVTALLALERGLLPGTLNSRTPDPACGPQIRFDNAEREIRFAMNNSFGFGGNNCSLVFGRA